MYYTSQKITPHMTLIQSPSAENLYLIEGAARAVLIDAGLGVGHLKDYVQSLTDKSLTILLSHGHLDHACGAGEFSDVYLNSADRELYRSQCKEEERRGYLRGNLREKFEALQPEDFAPLAPDRDFAELCDNMVFDLGGIHLRTVAFPGHTAGMTAFLVEEERSLITGDACNNATFGFGPEASTVEEYLAAVQHVRRRLAGKYDRVFVSHHETELPAALLEEMEEVCRDILAGRTDDAPFRFRGMEACIAKACSRDFKRTDGKAANLIYNKEKICRAQQPFARKYPNLCKPITIAGVTFRNRMFSAPMGGTDITNDGCIGPKSTAFYELRAKGGAGAVTVSECMVHPETDGSHAYHLDTAILNSLASATYTADAIRRHSAMPSLELSHSGMYAGTYMTDKTRQHEMHQWGPGDTTRPDGVPVRALSAEQLHEIAASYGRTAALAKRAGFEMVMIHGGHGWLINQFLSPYFNKRTDEYGGSLENRCRFAIEVLKAVREAVGPRFPIEFRMSGSELFEGGYDLAEGCRIAEQLEPYIDLLHVSAGTYQRGFGDTHPSMFKPHGCNVYLAAEIKKHVSVPVATLGGLNDPAQMEEIIASGKADIVYMARALLADPELPRKVTENRDADIVRCLRCFTCMAERAATSTRRCTVNPLIGRECDGTEVLPAPARKKVLVAGGGPGGLYAAYTAARRGHTVTLYEKEMELGGILKSERALPFKHEMYELTASYMRLAAAAGVKFRLGTAVTPELVQQECPDAVIVAVGSAPICPPIPGLNGENVVVVNDYYKQQDRVTDSVVVLGGGLAGCECAIHLGQQGKQVHLVEMRDTLAPDANVRHRPLLLAEVNKYVAVHTGLRGLRVTDQSVVCADADGKEILVPGTSVICALGQRSRTDVVTALQDTAPFVRVIGDAAKVSTITNAVYWGYHAALDV